jgi:hypothetical protein
MTPIFCHAFVTFTAVDNNGNPIITTIENIDEAGNVTKEITEILVARVTFAAYHAEAHETTQYAAAWTAPMDNFSRATGRSIAGSRLENTSAAHVRDYVVAAGNYTDFWQGIFANAMENSPCRWDVMDVSFTNPRPSYVPTVDAVV